MGDVVDLFGPRMSRPPTKTRSEAGRIDAGGGPECYDPETNGYQAYGRPGLETRRSLHVILRDGSAGCFQYADLESSYPNGCQFRPSAPGGEGDVITLRFGTRSGSILVILNGLRLRRVWQLLMEHMTHWIRELPTEIGLPEEDVPVIRSITLRPVAPSGR